MKRKPARKPAKKRRAGEGEGVPLPSGGIQRTLFPVARRPDAEVRAEEEREVLEDSIPSAALRRLEAKAVEILEDSQKWTMDHCTKPHRFSWGPGKKHFYAAEESVLRELVKEIAAAAFRIAADRYHPEIASLVVRLERQTRLLEQRRENGQMLAEEGRAAKKTDDDRRADLICKLYRRLRPMHPPGRLGNGAALGEVSRQFGPLPGKEKPVTKTAIRKTLKRRGIPCR